MRKRAILAALFLGVTALAARAVVRVDVKTLDRDRVLAAAAEYLAEKPVTLTAFPTARNPGGPHDYFSDSDYFWPDPKNPEGPYVQRDGQSNPANFTAHRHALIRMSLWVPALTSAWKLTGEEKFSAQAVAHLRAWFVDEATRMNPNLQYSQAVRNKYTGRCYGIIDTLHLVEVARSIELLREGQQLAPRDDAGLRQWFTACGKANSAKRKGPAATTTKPAIGSKWACSRGCWGTRPWSPRRDSISKRSCCR